MRKRGRRRRGLLPTPCSSSFQVSANRARKSRAHARAPAAADTRLHALSNRSPAAAAGNRAFSEVRAELADTAHKLAVATQQREREEKRHHEQVEDLQRDLHVANAQLEEQSRVLGDERRAAAAAAAHSARLLGTIEIQQESLAQYRADTERCKQLEADLSAAEDESARQVVA